MNGAVTPLHVHSGYSLLRGPTPLERLIELTCRLGHTHLALTDVNGLYGATVFYRRAIERGLTPIIGADLQQDGQAVVALVADETGYENLCRLISRIHRRREADAKADEQACGELVADLAELCDGLHLIVEDAELAGALRSGGAAANCLWLGVDPASQSSSRVRRLVECARKLSLPLVATGKTLLAEPEDADTARLLAAIRLGTTYDAVAPEELPPRGALLRGSCQLKRELAELPEAVANNRRLTEACRYKLLPRKVVFPSYPTPVGTSAVEMLRRLCGEGMARRYGRQRPAALRRVEKELPLIDRLGFSEYFLVVWDIVQFARRRGVPVAGRGSGASSLVAYLLGITNVCPLTYGISFERFLNEGRVDFPDLDIDFCWRVRDEVIDYAFRRWGGGRTAMVSTHNTFQERSALRETAKAFGFSDGQISHMERRGEDSPRLGRIATLARRIAHLPHNLSVHPGGIVIGRKPIDSYVPIQPAKKGVMITQYDKDGVEAIGLVKLDLLGNRSLSTIRQACEQIRRRGGRQIDIEALPPADPQTIRLLQKAQTVGCNQIESPAMRHLLLALQPRCARDVMKALALIRPGAASIGMKEAFIRRQRGLEQPPRGHPKVDAILKETGGVMLYEDDVMLVAAAMLGSSLAEADRFRKTIQKCTDDQQRRELSAEFLSRCRAAGVESDYARSMWTQMAKFNAYSFCRAHAGSYGILAYGVAYLKAHHPLEFWVAALNNNQSMYPLRVYVEQAKRAGVRFLRPQVNRAGEEFTIEADAIRVGLARVAGLGPAAVGAILEARDRGPFEGLSDCLVRTGLGRDEARALVLCGAFDAFGRSRPGLMMELNLFFTHPSPQRPGPGQGRLLHSPCALPDPPGDYSPQKKYLDEWSLLGLSVGEHIMSLYRPSLVGLVDADSRELPGRIGRELRIAGVLEARRSAPTRKGGTMMFLTLDDEFGLFEATVFPDAVAGIRSALDRYGPYRITGRVEEQYGSITINARRVELLGRRGETGLSFAPGSNKPAAPPRPSDEKTPAGGR